MADAEYFLLTNWIRVKPINASKIGEERCHGPKTYTPPEEPSYEWTKASAKASSAA
jgi:hypothetical protein